MNNSFSKKIIVQEEHLDSLAHVNNTVYLHWAQEIAGEHWFSVMNEKNTEEHYWVVHEHSIRYMKQVFLGEELIVKTHVEPMEGIRFPRVVEFFRADEVVVRVRTHWILVNAKTHRPKRIDTSTLALFGI